MVLIMPKLSKEQKRLLVWLAQPNNHLEICRQQGHSLNQVNGLYTYTDEFGNSYKFDIRTLNKLISEALVSTEIIYPFGLKHEQYALTKLGFEFVEKLPKSVQ